MQIYHHNTDSVRDLASFVAIRCSKLGVMVVSDTSSVFLLSSLFRVMLLVAITTVLHGPVADSLRTSSGPQPGDCRPLVYSMGVVDTSEGRIGCMPQWNSKTWSGQNSSTTHYKKQNVSYNFCDSLKQCAKLDTCDEIWQNTGQVVVSPTFFDRWELGHLKESGWVL